MIIRYIIVLIFCLVEVVSLVSQSVGINYFNSPPPPADSAVIFAPNVISSKGQWEEKICFSPDGIEMFFGRHPDAGANYFKPNLFTSKYKTGVWTRPDTAVFALGRIIGYPIMGLHGSHLYMEEPALQKEGNALGSIGRSIKENGSWSEIDIIIPEVPNKEGFGLAQITNDSTFYFHDRFDRIGYTSKLHSDGTFAKAEPLPSVINPAVEIFVSPDNDYIIFQPLNWSNQFHIVFRDEDDKWAMPIPFSAYFGDMKKSKVEGCGPYVSPDKKYFFFSREGDIYWVKADFIDVLRG